MLPTGAAKMGRILVDRRWRFALFWVAPVAVIATVVIAPLATGARTLVLRDVLNTHLGLRAFLGESLRRGELPLIDPLRAGGQPLIGNPNTVALYPDNALLLVGSTLWQLNAHFWFHGLVALAAMYWLARSWGLEREAAWVGAASFAASGFLLSQMNLYNGVAGVALAPALAAATLRAGGPKQSRRALVGLALLWALELLAGDPILALLALAFALILARELPLPRGRVLLALAIGTALAAPQLEELLRQLPTSFRAGAGHPQTSQVAGNPGPRALIEIVQPLFHGRPDLQQIWAKSLFGGIDPLYYSLAPGVLVLALLIVALGSSAGRGRPGTRIVGLWFCGAAFAFSGGSIGALLSRLPAGDLFRYSVKFALWAAVGGSLLAAIGFARAIEERQAERTLRRALLATSILCAVLGAIWAMPTNGLRSAIAALFAPGLGATDVEAYRVGWSATALIQASIALLLYALVIARRSLPELGGGLVALHVASQLLLLAPILATDGSEQYAAPPAFADQLPAAAVFVHGGDNDLFGARPNPAESFPDRRFLQLTRRAHDELAFPAGALTGRRYELVCSADKLDGYAEQWVATEMVGSTDAARLRILSATGVDLLMLGRPLAAESATLVDPVARFQFADQVPPLFVYKPRRAIAEAQLLGRVRFAASLPGAIAEVVSGRLDPTTTALVTGSGMPRDGEAGKASVISTSTERLELAVESQEGGVALVRRAWLPHWKATIDGQRAETRIADLTRLAVLVPPGRHEIRLWIDRRPFRAALALSGAALFALAAVASGIGSARESAA
jgi:hypothetical protein